MALAELIGKLRLKKQQASRTTFGHYLEAVRTLASGGELDADEVGHIIAAAGKNEDDLTRDVGTQQQRDQWHATLLRHRQASTDQRAAAAELERAQAALNEAIRKLEPAVAAARAKLDGANHSQMVTAGAESWLSSPANLLDVELLEHERTLNQRLREVNSELSPLEIDLGHKQDSLRNAEHQLARIQNRGPGNTYSGVGVWLGLVQPNETPTRARITDLQRQIAQLTEAIEPRRREQQRLQAELNGIHARKLER